MLYERHSVELSDLDRENLKAAIKQCGLSQTELAIAAGVHQPWLSQVLTGRRWNVERMRLQQVVNALHARFVASNGIGSICEQLASLAEAVATAPEEYAEKMDSLKFEIAAKFVKWLRDEVKISEPPLVVKLVGRLIGSHLSAGAILDPEVIRFAGEGMKRFELSNNQFSRQVLAIVWVALDMKGE